MKLVFSIVLLVVAAFVHRVRGQNALRVCPSVCPIVPACNLRVKCRYGVDIGFCNCCRRCFKGPDEECGGTNSAYGKCQDRFYCDTSFITDSNIGTTFNSIGSCKPKLTSPCFVPCNLVLCQPIFNCKFGIGKDFCGCCNVCLQGLGEPCGQLASCGKGLFCDESGGITGICRIWNVFTFAANQQLDISPELSEF